MAQQKPLVLCVGDSQTDGTAGSSFVQRLAKANPHLQFRACGVNGMPSESMTKRMPQLLRRYLNPAAVLIMAGSNDCLEQQCWSLSIFYRLGFWITRPATQEVFVENMSRMVDTVQRTCPKAKVVVLTCPPLSEQPHNAAFQRTTEYNAALQQHLRSHHPGAAVADVHTAFVQFLQKHAARSKQLQMPVVRFNVLSCVIWQPTAVLQHYLLRRSWDEISRLRGLQLLTDNVHINDTAAQLVAQTVQPFLQGVE